MPSKMLLIQTPGYGIQPSMGIYALQLDGVEILDLNLELVKQVFGDAFSLSLNEESMREQLRLTRNYWDRFAELQNRDALEAFVSPCRDKIKDFKLFGISVHGIWEFLLAARIAEYVKRIVPNAVVVFGGPAIDDYYPEIAVSLLKYGDVVVQGDGTAQIKLLLETGDPSNCFSTAFSKNECLFSTARKKTFPAIPEFHENWLKYPAPQAAAIPMNVGCYWGRCSFCAEQSYLGSYLKASDNAIVKSMMAIKNEGIPFLFLSGSGVRKNELKGLLTTCNELGKQLPGFGLECRAFPLDEELVNLLQESRCFRLNFGLESPDPAICNGIYNKGTDLLAFEKGLKLLDETGYRDVTVNLLIHPMLHKEDDIQRLSDFLNGHDCIREYVLYPLQIAQGTPIESWMSDRMAKPFLKPFGGVNYYLPEGFQEWYANVLHRLANEVKKPFSLMDEMQNLQLSYLAMEERNCKFRETQHAVLKEVMDDYLVSYFESWMQPRF